MPRARAGAPAIASTPDPGNTSAPSGIQGPASVGEDLAGSGIPAAQPPASILETRPSPALHQALEAPALTIAAEPEFPLGEGPEPEALSAVQRPADELEGQETRSSISSLRREQADESDGPANPDSPEAPETKLTAAVIADRRPTASETAALRASSAALSNLSLPARLEAILYLKGRPLGLAELAEIAGIDRDQAEMALITLMTDYAHRDTALEIRQEGQRYSLQLRDSLGDLVQNLLPVDLSTAALRTLATIALKKRILQSELVELRGSGAYDHIKELLAQEFIERRRQSEGRSYWLSLSEKFHRTFAVSADDLGQRRRQAA